MCVCVYTHQLLRHLWQVQCSAAPSMPCRRSADRVERGEHLSGPAADIPHTAATSRPEDTHTRMSREGSSVMIVNRIINGCPRQPRFFFHSCAGFLPFKSLCSNLSHSKIIKLESIFHVHHWCGKQPCKMQNKLQSACHYHKISPLLTVHCMYTILSAICNVKEQISWWAHF